MNAPAWKSGPEPRAGAILNAMAVMPELDDGGLPVHLYPFPVTIEGYGPADEHEAFRMICWCGTDGCLGR